MLWNFNKTNRAKSVCVALVISAISVLLIGCNDIPRPAKCSHLTVKYPVISMRLAVTVLRKDAMSRVSTIIQGGHASSTPFYSICTIRDCFFPARARHRNDKVESLRAFKKTLAFS
jgi:hypothetical protein